MKRKRELQDDKDGKDTLVEEVDEFSCSDESDNEDNCCSSDAEEGEEGEEETIDVSFDFKTPQDTDFHAVKKMLSPLFPDCNALSQLVDDVVVKASTGCSVYLADGDDENDDNEDEDINSQEEPVIPDPISVSALVDTRPELLEWLKENVKSKEPLNSIKKCFINTRLINLPFDIVPPSLGIVLKDLESMKCSNDDKVIYMVRQYCLNGEWNYYQEEDQILIDSGEGVSVFPVKNSTKTRDAVFYDEKILVKTVCVLTSINQLKSFLQQIIEEKQE